MRISDWSSDVCSSDLFGLSTFLVVLYGIVPPPVTPLMLIRVAQGEGLHKDWVPFDRVSPHLMRALIASEDAQYCNHGGFDWKAIKIGRASCRERLCQSV